MKKQRKLSDPKIKRSLVYFDGAPLDSGRVKMLAKDPVVDWGFVFQNDQVVQGEFWLIVGRKSKFIYFHLTDDLQPKSGLTEYGGYTVKIKSIMTDQFYNLGRGSEVPVIGNPRDAFLATTTKLMLNSKFCDGIRPRVFLDPQTGQAFEAQSLLHLVDLVQAHSIPYAQSASRSVGIQAIAPDGDLLDESSVNIAASASGSTDCQEFGQAMGETVAGLSTSLVNIHNYVDKVGGAMVGSVIGGPVGAGALTIASDVQTSLHSGISNLATGVTKQLYTWVGETICNMATGATDNDTLKASDIEFPKLDVEGTAHAVLVCDAVARELVGSVATTDTSGDIEEVTVEGITELVCTDWHVEWVTA